MGMGLGTRMEGLLWLVVEARVERLQWLGWMSGIPRKEVLGAFPGAGADLPTGWQWSSS